MTEIRSKVPHTLVLLFAMIWAAYVATLFLDQGAYQRKTVAAAGGDDVVRFPSVGQWTHDQGDTVEVAQAGMWRLSSASEDGASSERVSLETTGAWSQGDVKVQVFTQGQYEFVGDVPTKTVVAPGTYAVNDEPERLMPWAPFLLIPKGFAHGAEIIIFIFIVGGAFGVLRATGATDALIGAALKRFGHRPSLLIFGGLFLFAAGSSLIGMAEEYLPFVPLLLALCIGLGFDAVTAIGILCIGYGTGYGVAAINPFTVIIAQNIAGLEATSGWQVRAFLTIPFLAVGFLHVYRYAMKVKRDPTKSLVADIEVDPNLKTKEYPRFNAVHTVVLSLLAIGIGVFVWGINEKGWYLKEMGALFLILTVVMAVVALLSPNRAAVEFIKGAQELSSTAILIGFAYTIEVVLSEGKIIDTIIHGIAEPLGELTPSLSAVGMFFVQCLCNFFIPSGSGQAYVTMPLMAPISDLVDVPRQTAVLAYQFGDGFTNILVPTNAVLVGILAMARIPYERWLRFILPFMIQIWILGSIVLALTVKFGYS